MFKRKKAVKPIISLAGGWGIINQYENQLLYSGADSRKGVPGVRPPPPKIFKDKGTRGYKYTFT